MASKDLNKRTESLEALNEQRAQLRRAAEFVATAGADDAIGAHEQAKLIRQWAKIRKVSEEIRVELLRLEFACVRRMIELDCTEHMTGNQRAVARWAASVEDVEMAIRDFPDIYTLHSLRGAWQDREQARSEAERRARWARGEHTEDELRYAERMRRRFDRYEAAQAGPGYLYDPWKDDEAEEYEETPFNWQEHQRATVIDMILQELDFLEGQQCEFTIDTLTEKIMDGRGIDDDLRHGVAEMCRNAMRRGSKREIVLPDGTRLPRVIVFPAPNGSVEWVRVFSSGATLAQFEDMVRLRRTQLAQDQAKYDELCGQLQVVSGLARDCSCSEQASLHDILEAASVMQS